MSITLTFNHHTNTRALTGHNIKDWDKLFGSVATIPGVEDMEKCVLLPDEEEALTTSFNKSPIPKTLTAATCNIHSEWKLGKQPMSNGCIFGRR